VQLWDIRTGSQIQMPMAAIQRLAYAAAAPSSCAIIAVIGQGY
jgi:hypothetical protein